MRDRGLLAASTRNIADEACSSPGVRITALVPVDTVDVSSSAQHK